MKAACNGVLNFSVLDGWWDEAYDLKNGWAIGNREVYTDKEYQDEVESKAIYSILEKDIIPLFYERGSDGLPREWIRMMKHSLVTIASRYNTNRMVKEYFNKFYKPAAENFARLSAEDFAAGPRAGQMEKPHARGFPRPAHRKRPGRHRPRLQERRELPGAGRPFPGQSGPRGSPRRCLFRHHRRR